MFGNWIDLAVIIYLFIVLVSGLRRGLISVVIDFFCFGMAFILTIFSCQYAADFLVENFEISSAAAPVAAFFICFFAFKILLSLAIHTFCSRTRTFPRVSRSFFNRLLGATMMLAYGSLVVFVILSLIFSLSLPAYISDHFYGSKAGSFVAGDPLKLNPKLRSIFGDVLKETMKELEFLTVETGSNEVNELNFKAVNLKLNRNDEAKMLDLINQERQKRGLVELVADESIREVARDYAFYMFENSYVAHRDLKGRTPAERLKDAGIECYSSGENIALSENVDSAHRGLMNSPGHRKNILWPFFRKVGIGAVDGGEYGVMFVQNFTD